MAASSLVFRLGLIVWIMLLSNPPVGQASPQSATAQDRSNSNPNEKFVVAGLEGPAEILIDPWGIPHIYASTHYDAFFVQGFNAARDRLWQIDLWRRRGLGLLSEVLGGDFAEQDRAARLFLYRGDMYTEWLSYGSDAKRIATAFTNGLNAYIKLALSNDRMLPWEFKQLNYQPALWAPEDVVRIRSHGLVRNVRSEVARARFVANFGLQADRFRRKLEPAWTTVVPEGLNVGLIPEDVLHVYDLATGGVGFDEEESENAFLPPSQLYVRTKSVVLSDGALDEQEIGSNNWAVSPNRTKSGRAILANDPHRGQSVPSLRYLAHLVAPGLNVIGAGEPALPGISIGHNEKIAFGLTIFSIDQEDLYVYRTKPGSPLEYWYQGRWEPMKVVKEILPIRQGESRSIELVFTRHGPIIYDDPEENIAFAVRAAWLEPGMAPYFGSVEYMRAQNWDEFLAAMNRWGAPSENQVYADVEGNIGWAPRGRAPIRPNWDGLFPVPGDGRYEWAGFYDQDLLPVEFNPGRGWVATANEMNLPQNYPYRERKLGFEWASPWRKARISEVLASETRSTLEAMLRLQTDRVSIPGRKLQRILSDLSASDSRTQFALDALLNWDAVMDNDSQAAAIFHAWFDQDHLGKALLKKVLDSKALEAIDEPHDLVVVEMAENPQEWIPKNPVRARDEAILSSLASALDWLEEKLGTDVKKWRFGLLNQMEMKHALSPLVDSERRIRIDIPPSEKHAVSGTVASTGASWRQVLDVGNWDNSIAMSNPGQSGDPESPYYRNLWPRWLQGGAFPLLFTRERIEAIAERRIVLMPEGD